MKNESKGLNLIFNAIFQKLKDQLLNKNPSLFIEYCELFINLTLEVIRSIRNLILQLGQSEISSKKSYICIIEK